MSIFDRIKNAIFTRKSQGQGQSQQGSQTARPGSTSGTAARPANAATGAARAGSGVGAAAAGAQPQIGAGSSTGAAGRPQTGGSGAMGAGSATGAGTAEPVDVEEILEDLAKKSPQPLNWRTSIVDLMKLLDLDSSLANRKELAQELGYTGSTSDSAAMNVWLHKQVMNKLAESGGKVPASLRD